MIDEEELKRTQLKCKSCGGNLKFSPDDKSLKCNFCKSLEKIDYKATYEKHLYTSDSENQKEYKVFKEQNKLFKCTNCGANIYLNTLEVSKNCPYCSSPCVADESEMAGLVPDAIIPFKFSHKKASQVYKQNVKKKKFIPNIFKKQPPIDEIKGIYIPSFAYDADSLTKYTGRLGYNKTRRGFNGRTETYTTYKNISGTYTMQHKNVLVETSSHIDQANFNSIKPYNENELVDFDTKFIMGYSVEQYNQSLSACKNVAQNMMESCIKSNILNMYSYDFVDSYTQQSTFSNEKFAYFLMPTYKISFKYKKKNYTTFMNGQTGKVGKGIPLSWVKILFLVLFILIIVGAFVSVVLFVE